MYTYIVHTQLFFKLAQRFLKNAPSDFCIDIYGFLFKVKLPFKKMSMITSLFKGTVKEKLKGVKAESYSL